MIVSGRKDIIEVVILSIVDINLFKLVVARAVRLGDDGRRVVELLCLCRHLLLLRLVLLAGEKVSHYNYIHG